MLKKLFIKDYTNTSNPVVRNQYGKVAGIFGIITNGNEGVGLFVRSFVYLIGLIVLIINKRGGANSSFMNSNSANRNKNQNFFGHLRLEWRPDSMTTFFMRGSVSTGDTENASETIKAIYDADPFAIVDNPFFITSPIIILT